MMVREEINRVNQNHILWAFNVIYLFIYLWLCWVFVSIRGLSLVAASGGPSSSRCAGLSLSRPLLLRSTGSRRAGSAIVAHGPSRSAACGIVPDQGSNPCPLHWQADSQPLRHQGSPPQAFRCGAGLSKVKSWLNLHHCLASLQTSVDPSTGAPRRQRVLEARWREQG